MGKRKLTLNNATISYDPEALRVRRPKVTVEMGPAVIERDAPARETPSERTAREGRSHRDAMNAARERYYAAEDLKDSERQDYEDRKEKVLQKLDQFYHAAEMARARRRGKAVELRRGKKL